METRFSWFRRVVAVESPGFTLVLLDFFSEESALETSSHLLNLGRTVDHHLMPIWLADISWFRIRPLDVGHILSGAEMPSLANPLWVPATGCKYEQNISWNRTTHDLNDLKSMTVSDSVHLSATCRNHLHQFIWFFPQFPWKVTIHHAPAQLLLQSCGTP